MSFKDSLKKVHINMNEFSFKRTWGPEPRLDLVKAYKRKSDSFVFIAGPCSVESHEQIEIIADHVSKSGATHLRGGVFRAGTYPGKSFGWIDESLIKHYHSTAKGYGLKNVIEVLDYTKESFDLIEKHCDVFQVGARAMQNYTLLRKLGEYDKPVFLKRNQGSTVDEWLGAAEHLLFGGVKELYLIDRGSSSYHTDCRWAPTLHTIPSVKSICDVPIIFDASHSTGRRDFVGPMAMAGVAAGSDGLLVETHYDPEKSLSDSEQAISLEEFSKLSKKIKSLRHLLEWEKL
jgi:3-deoxy-7-phosphoheptulonate synthase